MAIESTKLCSKATSSAVQIELKVHNFKMRKYKKDCQHAAGLFVSIRSRKSEMRRRCFNGLTFGDTRAADILTLRGTQTN